MPTIKTGIEKAIYPKGVKIPILFEMGLARSGGALEERSLKNERKKFRGC